jgi:hypothetical protein
LKCLNSFQFSIFDPFRQTKNRLSGGQQTKESLLLAPPFVTVFCGIHTDEKSIDESKKDVNHSQLWTSFLGKN